MRRNSACWVCLTVILGFNSFAYGSNPTEQETQKSLNELSGMIMKAHEIPRLQLKDEDVITDIDGQRVDTPQQALQKLNSAKAYPVQIVRDGEQTTFHPEQEAEDQPKSAVQDQ